MYGASHCGKFAENFTRLRQTLLLTNSFFANNYAFDWCRYAGLGAIFGFDTCSTVLSASCWYDTILCSASMILLCKVFSASMILFCAVCLVSVESVEHEARFGHKAPDRYG